MVCCSVCGKRKTKQRTVLCAAAPQKRNSLFVWAVGFSHPNWLNARPFFQRYTGSRVDLRMELDIVDSCNSTTTEHDLHKTHVSVCDGLRHNKVC